MSQPVTFEVLFAMLDLIIKILALLVDIAAVVVAIILHNKKN